MQIMFRERENIFDQCLLDSDEDKVEPVVYNNPDYGLMKMMIQFKNKRVPLLNYGCLLRSLRSLSSTQS